MTTTTTTNGGGPCMDDDDDDDMDTLHTSHASFRFFTTSKGSSYSLHS